MHNIWTLKQLDEHINGYARVQACINGKWVPSRPLNYTCRTLKERFVEAWMVFTGKAEAFIWPEGQ